MITLFLSLFCSNTIFAQDLNTFEFDLSKIYIDLNSNNKRNFKADGTRKTEAEKIKEVRAEYAEKGRELLEEDIVFLSAEFIQKIKAKAKEKQERGVLNSKYEFLWGAQKNGGQISKKDLKEEGIGKIAFQNKDDGTKFNVKDASITIAFLKDEDQKGYDYYTVPVLEGGTLTEETIESVKNMSKKGEYIIFKDLVVEHEGRKFKVPADFKFTLK